MDRETIRLSVLLVCTLCILAGMGIYTYNFYKDCNGAVVRGVIGLACVDGGNQ